MSRAKIDKRLDKRLCQRFFALSVLMALLVAASTRSNADTGTCGRQITTLPFTDVLASNIFFCSIAEAYYSALTNGTSSTTYSPAANVPREQMAAFITRTMDQALKRGSRRAALNQFWTTQGPNNIALTNIGTSANLLKSDGTYVWVADSDEGLVGRVTASAGGSPSLWTGADAAFGVLCAMGKVFVTGRTSPGSLYRIDESSVSATTLSSSLGSFPESIAYDGERIWTANAGNPFGSVSIVSLNPTSVTTAGTSGRPAHGILYDGANIWVTEDNSGAPGILVKLNSFGNPIQTVDVGNNPRYPVFDGTNIWVPNRSSNTVTVVRATGGLSGTVLATLSGNGLASPTSAAFDGERILITNNNNNSSVSLWKATDLTPIGTFSTGTSTFPFGACSDGLNFWITLNPFGGGGKLGRF